MDKLLILANFKVDVPVERNAENDVIRSKPVAYTKGMVIDAADVPEGQSADDWIEKGLAEKAA